MKNKIIKISAVFLTVLIILSSFVIPTFAEGDSLPKDIETSGVVSDLKAMGFDITKYQKDTSAEHARMLKFLEYGYDENGDQSEYGLYVYVWNPSGKPIELDNNLNKITIQSRKVQSTNPNGWKKAPLEFVNVSTESGYENVFYKFKVPYSAEKSLLSNVSKYVRVYEISEIELKYSGNNNATSFTIGGRFTYSGYGPYHNASRTNRSTLSCHGTDMTVIEIEINPTTWKTDTSAKGVGYANELFSVYFSVPNDIIRDYGNTADTISKGLVKIEGEYSKHRINGLVVDNRTLYDQIYPYLGVNVNDEDVPFFFYSDISYLENYTYYENPYNVKLSSPNIFGGSYVTNSEPRGNVIINKIVSLIEEDIYSSKDFVSSEDLRDVLYSIWADFGSEMYIDPVGSGYGPANVGVSLQSYGNNLSYVVTSKDEKGNYVDIADQIKVYSEAHDKPWYMFWNNSLYEESSYDNIKSIQFVDLSFFDLFSNSSSFSDKFYVSEHDVANMKSFVTAASAKNQSTFLMRFAVDDYYATDVRLSEYGTGTFENALYFEKTIFTNVDILSFTFENQFSEQVVLPVAASPVDNVGEITPTLKPDGSHTTNENPPDDPPDLLSLILGLVAIIAVVLFIDRILRVFGISWRSLFKFIRKLFKKIFTILKKCFDKLIKAIKKLFK